MAIGIYRDKKSERSPEKWHGSLRKFADGAEVWRVSIVLAGSGEGDRFSIEFPVASLPLVTGECTLEVDGTIGLCTVEESGGILSLIAPWLGNDEAFRGFDRRSWNEWILLMDSSEHDMDHLTLTDGMTRVTFAELRSIRAKYPQGPFPGTCEMTISKQRRLVVLTQDDESSRVYIELGLPLAMRAHKSFHATTQITDIASLEQAVIEAQARFGKTIWWRGQAELEWNLIPGAHRDGQQIQENWLLTQFIRGFIGRSRQEVTTDQTADVMILAQHHHLPTRLLDWSESALVALFFAVERDNGRDGTLWAICPFDLNEVNAGDRYIFPLGHPKVKNLVSDSQTPQYVHGRPTECIAVQTTERHQRMVAQLSRFTIHGAGGPPLEDHPYARKYLLRFVIPASAKSSIRHMLWLLGVRRSVLFPDLDNLAKDLRQTDLIGLTPSDHLQRINDDIGHARLEGWRYEDPFKEEE